jgi:hypothetical protein
VRSSNVVKPKQIACSIRGIGGTQDRRIDASRTAF